MEQMKLDLMRVLAKNSESTPSLLKPDIGPQSSPSAARRDNQIGALKAAVAKSGRLRDQGIGIIRLHILAARRKQLRQLFGEVQIVANDDRDRRRQDLWRIGGRGKSRKPALALGTPDPHKTRRATIPRSRPEFHQIIQLTQLLFGHRLLGPPVTRAA